MAALPLYPLKGLCVLSAESLEGVSPFRMGSSALADRPDKPETLFLGFTIPT